MRASIVALLSAAELTCGFRRCRADFKTRTDSEAYNLVLLPIANLMIFVFTCGVPPAMAYLFQWPWKWWGVPGRKRFDRQRAPAAGTATADRKGNEVFDLLEFWMAGYRAERSGWMLVEVLFLLTVANLFIYFKPGSWAQACCMAMFTAVAAALGVRYRPYEAAWANGFHIGSWLAVTMVLLITAALRHQDEGPFAADVFNFKLRGGVLFGMVLALCAAGVPVAAVLVARRVLPDASGREGGDASLVVTVANPADASLMPS